MPTYKAPGVYVEEISTLPPSIAEVATAIPAFIGYTEIGPADKADPVVARISSMLEFRTAFGGAPSDRFTVTAPADAAAVPAVQRQALTNNYSLYYALRLYFINGGGPCYIVSVGKYGAAPGVSAFRAGLAALEKEDEPTLIVLTDAAALLSAADYYALCADALSQCRKLGDRFTILDVQKGDWQGFRNSSAMAANLSYGAAYHPYLQTSIAYEYRDDDVSITRSAGAPTGNVSGSAAIGGDNGLVASFSGPSGSTPNVSVTAGTAGKTPTFAVSGGALSISDVKGKSATDVVTAWNQWKTAANAAGYDLRANGTGAATFDANIQSTPIGVAAAGGTADTLAKIKSSETALYNRAKAVLDDQRIVLPPSAAMAGIYARVDREQGVWKAPANVGVLGVLGAVSKITNDDQENLNIDPTAGKSINAIRDFTGKGTMVWGARTLAGNDNEWRYIPVRRLFITIEESARKASAFAVFEPNDQATWLKVKAMVESYLYSLWERGALAGAKPEQAYYVHVGLGTTMTAQDVLEGRMIVEIGVAAVRPAEFVILRFSHKLQSA